MLTDLDWNALFVSLRTNI